MSPPDHYLPFVTSSAIDRFFACAGSVTLPQIRDQSSDAAQAGTDEHADRLRPGMLPQKVLDWFGGVEPAYEVAMAIDASPSIEAATARYLGSNIERGYGTYPGPAWVAGTADTIQILGGVVSVGDLKTGRGQAMGSLPSPDRAGQLLSLAWMAISLKQQSEYEKRLNDYGGSPTPIAFVAWRPERIRLMWWITADREDDLVDAEITYEDLQDWVYLLRQRIHLARAGGPARLHRGPHCANCPAFDACPAQGGAVRRVAELSGRGGAVAALADADVVAAHLDIQAAEKSLDAAKRALRLRVQSRGAVSVDDTHELRLVAGTDTRLDPNVALEVLGERFLDCADVTVSQAGMRRGLGAADVSAIIEEMRKRGGVITAPKAPYLRVLRKREAE